MSLRPSASRWPTVRRAGYALILLFALLGGVYSFGIEPNRLVVHHEELALSRWNEPPLRIVAISDLHLGAPFMTREKARTVVQLVNDQKPDLIVILGDFVVGSQDRHMSPAVIESLGELAALKSRLGTIAVLGNHDWWSNTQTLTERLDQLGIRVLENHAEQMPGGFWIWGLADLWERRPEYSDALRAVPADATVIALAHNPDVFPSVPERVVLTLAGHTHGGQVALPLIGRPIVPSSFGQRYAAGRVHERGHDLFVTTGIGTSILPIRFGVVPEIAVLEVSGPGPTSSGSSRTPR